MQQEHLSKIDKHIDGLKTEAINLMKAIIPIKALGPLNDGQGEGEKAEFIKHYLRTSGFKDIRELPAPDPKAPGGMRPNVAASLAGRENTRTIWILTHLDVVPAGDLARWESDPFEAVVKDGKIYGRGSEDNHQSLVSSVIAARALIDLEMKPRYNLGLVMVADEETGSQFGLQYLVENHAEMFSEDDLIIVPDAGEPDGSMIVVAEKSIMWVRFQIHGKQIHASTPDKGINAFKAGARLVVALDELHTIYNARDDVFDIPYSTFEPTKKEANVPNVNTIPGDDVFYLDCRILPQYDIEAVMKTMREICDDIEHQFKVRIDISTEQKEQAAPATDKDAPVVQALRKAIKEVYQIEAQPMGIGGGTVAAIFRRAGFPAAVWSTIDDLAHQPNEYCVISNMINDAKVFAHVALNG